MLTKINCKMALAVLRRRILNKRCNWKYIHTTAQSPGFWEGDKKGGFPHISDHYEPERGPLDMAKHGYQLLKQESKVFYEELREKFQMDPILKIPPGEVDVHWKFDGNPEILDKFVVSADSDINVGYSTASLDLTPEGRGIFSGVINTEPIKDGRVKAAGYCNVRTVRPMKSFYRDDKFDWGIYTHLILRIRGDGRCYMLNIYLDPTFDVMWHDLHNFTLHTRGGPYWQYVKIPFSKFFLSSKGRVQDKQGPPTLTCVTSISITAADIPGPFKLEIDFIGTERDKSFNEEFAYELYKPPNPYYI